MDFQTTRWSMIRAAGNGSPQSDVAMDALETLCRTYWRPLYVYARHSGNGIEQAEDLTQGFLADFLSRDGFGQASPTKGKFRTFLLSSFQNFVRRTHRDAGALKRGGGRQALSIDIPEVERRYQMELVEEHTPESLYERRFLLDIIGEARRRLEGEYQQAGKAERIAVLAHFLPGGERTISQEEAASRLDTTVAAVKSEVYRLRRRFGECVREEMINLVSSADELEAELTHLRQVVAGG